MTARESFWAYRQGWCDGAGARTRSTVYVEHPTRPDLTAEYEKGFVDGSEDRNRALEKAIKRTGHVPAVLRTA